MKKFFIITLFTIGITSTIEAQSFCVDQNDTTSSTTGSTGFYAPFDFPSASGTDTVWLAVDCKIRT